MLLPIIANAEATEGRINGYLGTPYWGFGDIRISFVLRTEIEDTPRCFLHAFDTCKEI